MRPNAPLDSLYHQKFLLSVIGTVTVFNAKDECILLDTVSIPLKPNRINLIILIGKKPGIRLPASSDIESIQTLPNAYRKLLITIIIITDPQFTLSRHCFYYHKFKEI
jgi:hypothetical protein